MVRTISSLVAALLAAGLLLPACAAPLDVEDMEEPTPDDAPGEAEDALRLRGERAIPFSVVDVDVDVAELGPTRRLITSAEGWRRLFGSAPRDVDFPREWAVVYSAGTQPTGGYQASVEEIRLNERSRTLLVRTALATPGAGCVVTQALTTPYVIVKFERPRLQPRRVRYEQRTYARDCEPTSACAAVLCPPDSACVIDPDGEPRCSPFCARDEDCRAEADYCSGCDCVALGPREALPACSGPGVRCFADPCLGRRAVCRDQVCALE